MKLMKIVVGLLVVLFLLLGGIAVLLLLSVSGDEILDESPPLFSVLETGTAAQYGYAVFNYRGDGELTVISYDKKPRKEVVVVEDSEALQASRFPELMEDLEKLREYGYEVSATDSPTIRNEIYVVPTGAIPSYVLFNLQFGTSNGTIVYIGETDLLLSKGVKQQSWYDNLPEEEKSRVVVYDGTLDEFLENGGSLADDILYENWHQKENSTIVLSGNGLKTAKADVSGSGYVRLIYDLEGLQGIYDTVLLSPEGQSLVPDPQTVYPWGKSSLRFSLGKTNGTAHLSIKKDGKVIDQEVLRRVTDTNFFLKKLQYSDPGEYIIEVADNSGIIATGLLHVSDLQITHLSSSGFSHVFSVNVDGKPLENTEVYVSLGESEAKKFYVSGGYLTVNAQLEKGENILNMEMLGTTVPVTVRNDQTGLLDFYLSYGLPGLFIVVLVYFGARMSRRPTYRLRFGDVGTSIRQEIRLSPAMALDSFRRIRNDMNLGSNPITPHEFSVSLKRYLTNGADVTEGNVEEILKKLVRAGELEAHRDYYQLKGEGDVQRNTLSRIIREKLIENGTMFKEKNGKFVTNNYEIGFFGDNFSKKGIIVVDSVSETRSILNAMNDKERSQFKLMQANGVINLVPVDRLDDVL